MRHIHEGGRGAGGVVWSTEHGEMCPRCDRPVEACTCAPAGSTTPNDGVVRVGRQTKGRKGKGATVVTGIRLGQAELAQLGKDLKKRCGSGGTVRNGEIEIQGDHRDAIVAELEQRGWTVKRVGG